LHRIKFCPDKKGTIYYIVQTIPKRSTTRGQESLQLSCHGNKRIRGYGIVGAIMHTVVGWSQKDVSRAERANWQSL
jgi:hypothetical protein